MRAAVPFADGLPMPAPAFRVPLVLLVAMAIGQISVVNAALATARAAVPPPHPAGKSVRVTALRSVAAGPSVTRRADLMVDVLVAELAQRRGQLRDSYDGFVRVARASRDASALGVAARMGSQLQRKEVLELARLWANADPTNPQPHRLIAEALQSRGDWRGALDEWMRVRELGVDERFDTWLAIVSQMEVRRPPGPLDALLNWRRKRPNDHELQRLQALLMLQAGRVAQALAMLERYPAQDEQILRTRLDAYLALDDVAGAKRVIAEAGEFGVNVQPWRLDVADALSRTERFDDARYELESLVRAGVGDDRVLLMLAYVTLRQGDAARARRVLATVAGGDANRDLRNFYLGRAAELEQKWQEALDAYGRVGEGDQFIEARTRGALMLQKMNRLNDARMALTGLRHQRPTDAVALYLAEAEVLKAALNPTAAVALLDTALATRSTDRELRFGRAMARRAAGNVVGMEQDLRAILARDPNDAKVLNALGYSLTTRAASLPEALKLIERARRLAPQDTAVLDSLGWVSYRLGRADDALRYLREAYRHHRDGNVAAHLGEVLWVTGAQAEAQAIWREGLDIEPHNVELRNAMQRLMGKANGR